MEEEQGAMDVLSSVCATTATAQNLLAATNLIDCFETMDWADDEGFESDSTTLYI